MFSLFAALVVQFRNAFADRRDVLLENAALRQQLAIYQRTGKLRLHWSSVRPLAADGPNIPLPRLSKNGLFCG
jgi:hypothetical protein